MQQEKERESLLHKIKALHDHDFDTIAHELYRYQVKYNQVFSAYVTSLGRLDELTYLPISAFKYQQVTCMQTLPTTYFESSGTTGMQLSRHYISDVEWYLQQCVAGFEHRFGSIQNYCILALLPHYSERQHSSLIAMVSHFIGLSEYNDSGFYLYNHEDLYRTLLNCKQNNIPTLLFGVSFALLDFVANHALAFPNLMVMETGGMKGRRAEMTRMDLHHAIIRGFGTDQVYSEYGMTELLSQAYSAGNGRFLPSSTMHVSTAEVTDPLHKERSGKTGLIRLIDLANIDSCAFILTEDLGICYEDGSFTIDGRLDNSDLRGCNLMVADMDENSE